jgi:thiaminase
VSLATATSSAADLLAGVQQRLAHPADANRLVPLIETGAAPRTVLAALAGEQSHVIDSDWRSFLSLAAAGRQPAVRAFYTLLAQGEGIVLEELAVFAAAVGSDGAALADHRPQAGCQGYPSYLCRLAAHADPADVVLAVAANFAAWGDYCARIAAALRAHYGLTDEQCGFFDFFATPAPELARAAERAIDESRADIDLERVLEYGRLLQDYELMFWNTLADGVA